MRQPVAQPKQRAAKPYSFPAPTSGWISNRNLALPKDGEGQGATVLDNFFPTSKGATLRRGSNLYATLGFGDKPVTAMFTYKVGHQDELFACTQDGIWNVSSVASAFNWELGTEDGDIIGTEDGDWFGAGSTDGLDVLEGTVGGDWITVQFATAGGVFLRGVNGEDVPFVYDGSTFEETPALTFPVLVPAAPEPQDLFYVCAYKERLFFLQKDSLDAWYLPVDQVAGQLTKLPLGGLFTRGGSLLFIATWSLGDGAQGGLSEQIVFVSTEGEVAVFQGANPSSASDWSKVGVYRIGKPLGKRAHMKAGGDLVIDTAIGKIALSQAIQRDFAALAPASVSYPIEEAWNEAVRLRPGEWNCVVWSNSQMVVVAPPSDHSDEPALFVANARTGAWSRFTGWDVTALCVWQGRLFFGSQDGRVVEANVTGADEGRTYTGTYIPLFEDIGAPDALKIGSTARFTVRAAQHVSGQVACCFDYDVAVPSPPSAPLVQIGNQWGNAIWGESIWSGRSDAVVSADRVSIGGSGYVVAPSYQVTSGAVVPLDLEIVRSDMTVVIADVVT